MSAVGISWLKERGARARELVGGERLHFLQVRILPVSAVARFEVIDDRFRHSPGAFDQHAVSDQKLASISDALHVARVTRTIKHRVLAQRDLLRDRSAAS